MHQKMLSLQEKQASQNFAITDFEPGPLTAPDVNKVIMQLLNIDDPQTIEGLPRLCFKRTMGNPYILKDEDLLIFEIGLLKWRLAEERNESVTVSSDYFVTFLQHRMKQLGEEEQLLLQCVACL